MSHEAPAYQVPFHSVLEAACASVPGAPAVAYAGASWTYSELDARVARAAGALERTGVVQGDVVALVLPNCPALVVGAIAAMRLGAIALVVDPTGVRGAAGRGDLAEILAAHRPRVIIVGERAWPPTRQALAAAGAPSTIVRVPSAVDLPLVVAALAMLRRLWRSTDADRSRGPSEGAVDWSSWLEGARAPRSLPRVGAGDPAAAFCTGGAQTVVLNHQQLVAGAAMLRAWLTDAALAEETWLVAASLGRGYAFTAALGTAVLQQGRVALVPRIAARTVADALRQVCPGFVVSRPGLADARLVRRSLRDRGAPDAVRAWLSPALHPSHGPSPSPVACTGLAPRGAAGFVACNPVNGVRVPGSVGLPLPGVAVRITDDRGFDLSPGSAGHLEVRAANLSCPDRWLRLDGAAWVDEAGFVYLAPRGQMNPGQMALGRGRETRAVDVGAGVGDAAPGFDGRP